MKKSYIQPDTHIVFISPMNPLLQTGKDPGVYGGNGSIDIVATDMDSNDSFFDGDEWETPSHRSLWED